MLFTYPLITIARAGAQAANTAYLVRSPNVRITYTITLASGSSQINFEARRLDASNRWLIGHHANGTFLLFEQTGGVGNTRATTAAAALTSGANVELIFRGDLIAGLINGTQAWSYRSESHMLQPGFQVSTSVFDGALSNIRVSELSR